MKITVYPINTIKLPLDIIFKIINSNEIIPFIKYNPGKNKENVYRLYTNNNITTDGQKVPILYMEKLNKFKINNLSKSLANRFNQIGFYIRYEYDELYCEFLENGNITIKFDMNEYKSIKNIETMLQETINVLILDKINKFLIKSGYNYVKIDKLTDNNIVINDMNYVFEYVKDDNVVNLNKYISCLSTIYNIENGIMKTQKDVMKLTYKRVSSYDKMKGITAYITKKKIEGIEKEEIMKLLIDNFNLKDKKSALTYISDWEKEIELKVDLNKKRIRVLNNPGFSIDIYNDYDENNEFKTYIVYDNVDNIGYIKYIVKYTFVLIDKFINNNISDTDKKTLCKGKKELELDVVKDIQPEKTQLVKNQVQETGRIVMTQSDISNELNQLLDSDNQPSMDLDLFEESDDSDDDDDDSSISKSKSKSEE